LTTAAPTLAAVPAAPPRPGSDLADGPPEGPAGGPLEERDREGMELALAEARAAFEEDEVPVGAVVVLGSRVVGRGHNRTRAERDPTAHAEVLAIREAARTVGAQRLVGATVYTTVEPCFMCAGALVHARVARVVWALRDPKFGACASLGRVLQDERLNHRCQTAEGVGAQASRSLLRRFFERLLGPVVQETPRGA
jgi:tRNA(adenine34) deaminase